MKHSCLHFKVMLENRVVHITVELQNAHSLLHWFSSYCTYVCIVCSTRQENESLKLEYRRLQQSYLELEQIRDSLQENRNLRYTNVTDTEQELELSKSQASCNYPLVVVLAVILNIQYFECFVILFICPFLQSVNKTWRKVEVHRESKKQDTKLLAITSPTIIQFSQFFY